MNVYISKIKSAKKKFFFLHFVTCTLLWKRTLARKKKARQDDSRMIRRVTALQREPFRIQSWREFVIEYDDHSCTNEPRPMQHIRCR